MLVFRIIQMISALALIIIVLFQSGKKSGLSGAIAGGGSDTFMARNKSSNLDARLARMTKWVAGVFVVLTLVLNLI